MLSKRISLQMSTSNTIQLNEAQLVDISYVSRKKGPAMQGYLIKIPTANKLTGTLRKKNSQSAVRKWCQVFMNFFFTYESETACALNNKPSCVLFLENCSCSIALLDRLPDQSTFDSTAETAFCISYEGDYSENKQYVYLANDKDERDKWISIINNSSMYKLHEDYQLLQKQYDTVQNRLATSLQELKHLKQQQLESQEDLAHLRASLAVPPRRTPSSSSGSPSSPAATADKVTDIEDYSARILQSHIRGWIIRRRWQHIVSAYVTSSHASLMRKRNQLIWKFVANEEEYVNKLNILSNEFRNQFEIAACSNKPLLSLEQSVNIFRNCNELLLFHQLFLRALHNQIDKWPIVILGDVFKLFLPMLALYHQYIGNHTHAFDVLFDLKFRPKFKEFVKKIESRLAHNGVQLEELLAYPLKRIPGYIQELNELKAHTPLEHIDYTSLTEMIRELETVHKTVTDEVSLSENIRNVLKIESKIEGGCEVLIDKEQTLVRKGFLGLFQHEDKLLMFPRKSKRRQNYCFLFSKHLLLTQRVEKKHGEECYRFVKENGILPLTKCRIQEHAIPEYPELRFLAFGIIYESNDSVTHTHILIASSVSEKAKWIADITQCIENEKQNKILHSQSQGQPVELNSKFIRYSTFKSGKEQLVNCGNLESLLQRLTKASYFGLDYLNTFLTTFPIFTTGQYVLDYLIKSYFECIELKSKVAAGMIPEEPVKETKFTLSTSSASNRTTLPGNNTRVLMPTRCQSTKSSNGRDSSSVSGIFFALKHWICKHYYHFKESQSLDIKLQELLDTACQEPRLSSSEKRVILEVSQLYMMQKDDNTTNEQSLVLQYFLSPKTQLESFDVVLSWQPRKVAEQLCLIDGVMFCQIKSDELLRYLTCKKHNKSDSAPNVVNSIQLFNRMSIFWMWAVAKQQNEANKGRVIEFLIALGMECYQLNNYMSTMAILGALEHSTILRYTSIFDNLSKQVKLNLRTLRKLGSTDSGYRELKSAIRKATPPLLPYLALTMNELIYVSESMSNYIEGDLINFAKMRKYTKICHSVLQHQKDTYDFPFDTEISNILLCSDLPGDENVLYEFVDNMSPPTHTD